MGIVDRYLEYAEAFERSYDDDDWSHIEPSFTEDAVYVADGDARGRDAVLRRLKEAVDGFDRKMDSRRVDFETPTAEGDEVRVRWTATYTKQGCPDIVLTGSEVATFEGDRIRRLAGEIDPDARERMGEWMAAHGARL